MSVLRMRRGGHVHRLVHVAETDVEVNGKGVEGVTPVHLQGEVRVEGQVLHRTCVKIQVKKRGLGSHNLLSVDNIDNRLQQSQTLDGPEVEALDVLPEVDLVPPVLRVLDRRNVHRRTVREYPPARGEQFVACPEDSVEHGFVQEEVPHPLADDNVHLLASLRHLNLLHLSMQDGDPVSVPVLLHDLLRLLHNRAAVHAHNVPRSCPRGEHGEDTSSTAHVEHHLALEHVRVVEDRVPVRQSSDLILQHLLVDSVVSVTIEVVISRPRGRFRTRGILRSLRRLLLLLLLFICTRHPDTPTPLLSPPQDDQ
eukprot:Hpha_TRINITY_DN15018_c1_g1::TRINITY_DN15018_c1_g1_i1::g.124702::m.124702